MLEFIMQYWLKFLFGIIIGIFPFLYKKIKRNYNVMKAIKSGVKFLLRAEIIRKYNEYKSKKYISLYDKTTLINLYKEYKNLGGNGVIEDMINDISEIPVVEEYGGD